MARADRPGATAWLGAGVAGRVVAAAAGLLVCTAAGAVAAAAGTPPLGSHSVLQPAGPQALHIKQLWDTTLVICTVVFLAVLAGVGIALWRARRARPDEPADVSSLRLPEPGPQRSVLAAVAASTLLLVFLIVASVFTDRALARLSLKDAIGVTVTANQWWWEIRYDDPDGSHRFLTANELHVPVGRPVVVTLKANDVIHSFWVPELHDKKDLIPGRSSQIQFQADKPGHFRGQCAEFCGLEHAFMAFEVVAEPPDVYAAWAERQRQPARAPLDARQQRGQQLFTSTSCVMCHGIVGTSASAQHGPDLTHLASRRSLAAGTLPNDAESLKQWIHNPQRFKPGVNMPASNLSGDELDAIVAYLGSLQ